MKISVLIAGLAGLGLAVWLLTNYGMDRILGLLGQAGWFGIAAVIAFHLVQIVFSASAWREIAGPMPRRPTLGGYFLLRWIREGVNNLLPVAQIGGEFVATRLMQRRGVPLVAAIAATVADLTMEMVTQIAFTLLGLGLLVHSGVGGGLTSYVASFVLVAVLVAAGFLCAQWFGVALLIENGLMRIGRTLGWAATTQVDGLHEALLSRYRRPRRLLVAMGWHSVSWLLGGVEVCLALHFLGHDTSISNGIVIESLGQALKAVVFVMPAALGVQEGSYIVICQVFNISPELAIALSLMKRLREVALGVPGLVTWRILSARGSHPDAQPVLKVLP
jgi:putative membrane protein